MCATLITRKIDDLGRIVIPKEIRKNLNIKNNEEIEIFVEQEKIILKKHYKLQNLENKIKCLLKSLKKYIDIDFLITDREKVIISSVNYQNMINKNISISYENLIEERTLLNSQVKENIEFSNEKILNKYFCIIPIVSNIDLLGSVLLISDKKIEEKNILIFNIITLLLKEE